MAAGSAWRLAAWTAMMELAREGRPFTADDVLAKAGHPDADHLANGANNAIGALFRDAKKQKLIEATGGVIPSTQPHRKGGMVRVWVGSPRLHAKLRMFT